MPVRPHRPRSVILVFQCVNHSTGRVAEFDLLAVMAQPAGKLTDHGHVTAIIRQDHFRFAADYEIATGCQARFVGKGELDAFGESPAGKIHLGSSTVEEFNVLQLI